jgi:hypothetical protein
VHVSKDHVTSTALTSSGIAQSDRCLSLLLSGLLSAAHCARMVDCGSLALEVPIARQRTPRARQASEQKKADRLQKLQDAQQARKPTVLHARLAHTQQAKSELASSAAIGAVVAAFLGSCWAFREGSPPVSRIGSRARLSYFVLTMASAILLFLLLLDYAQRARSKLVSSAAMGAVAAAFLGSCRAFHEGSLPVSRIGSRAFVVLHASHGECHLALLAPPCLHPT